MSQSKRIGFAAIVAIFPVLGTGLPAKAEWRDSPFAVSRQQGDGRAVVGRQGLGRGGLVGCQNLGGYPIGLIAPNAPIPNLNLPPTSEGRLEMPKPPRPADSGSDQ